MGFNLTISQFRQTSTQKLSKQIIMDETTGSPSSKLEVWPVCSLKEVHWLQKQSFFPVQIVFQAITQQCRRVYFELGLPTTSRVVPHFSSGIVDRAKRQRARKSPHARKGDTRRGDFHARSRFARSTIPEENWGLLVVYPWWNSHKLQVQTDIWFMLKWCYYLLHFGVHVWMSSL